MGLYYYKTIESKDNETNLVISSNKEDLIKSRKRTLEDLEGELDRIEVTEIKETRHNIANFDSVSYID